MANVTVRSDVTAGSLTISQSSSLSHEVLVQVQETVAGSTTNQELVCAVDVSKAKCVAMLAKGADLTVKTNSTGSPDDTINLTDGEALIWKSGGYFDNPLTVDVTKFYLTNADTADVTFSLIVLSEA